MTPSFRLLAGTSGAALLATLACGDESLRLGSRADLDQGGGASAGAGGSFAVAGAGGSSAVGGAGGSSVYPDSGGPPDSRESCSTAGTEWCACADIRAAGRRVDVIVVVDTSPSMDDEIVGLQAALNDFALQVMGARVDLRLILLASRSPGGAALCIPAPLGSGTCSPAGADSAMPRFFHHPTAALNEGSDLVSLLRTHEAELTNLLRPNAKLAIVIVSDGDTSSKVTDAIGSPDALVFREAMRGRDLQISALYAFSSCSTARTEGAAYRELASRSKGAHADLCSETVADGLTRVAADIVNQQACEFPIEWTPTGDKDNVAVKVVLNGVTEALAEVPAAEACAGLERAHYPDYVLPEGTAAHLCPATCAAVLASPDPLVTLLVGCLTSSP